MSASAGERRAEAVGRAQLALSRDPLEMPNALWHPHALDLADDVIELNRQIEEMATKVALVASTADGGCSTCVHGLRDHLRDTLPSFDWVALFDEVRGLDEEEHMRRMGYEKWYSEQGNYLGYRRVDGEPSAHDE